MSGYNPNPIEKVLTQEIAEQFLNDEDTVDLSGFTTIEDSAAHFLSKHQGNLYLDSLKSLSESAAESLSRHQGFLSLGNLSSLSEKSAEYLCTHNNSEFYSINDVSSVSHIILSARCGPICLVKITPEVTTRLSEALTENNTLDLSDLDDELIFSPDILRSLLNVKSQIIFGDIRISTSIAKNLSQFKAAALDLRESTILTAEAARALHGYQRALMIKLHQLEDTTKKIVLSHPSVKQWGQCNGPYVDVVCKNCGEQERLEFPDNEKTIYSVFGNAQDPKWGGWYWDLCPICCEELTKDQISELD